MQITVYPRMALPYQRRPHEEVVGVTIRGVDRLDPAHSSFGDFDYVAVE